MCAELIGPDLDGEFAATVARRHVQLDVVGLGEANLAVVEGGAGNEEV